MIVPLQDRVAVKPAKAKDKTSGGIIIPEKSKEPPTLGTIVAKGPGRTTPDGKLIPVAAEVGDVVYYSQYSGVKLPGDLGLVILREDDMLAIDRPDPGETAK